MPRSGKRPWPARVFRAGLTIAGDRPPRYGLQGRLPSTVGRGQAIAVQRSERETALVGVRFSLRSDARGGQAPALRFARPSPCHRRARACPSPCLDRHGKRPGAACVFCTGLTLAGDRPPRYGLQGRLPFTVGPRRASIGKTALAGVRFLRGSDARGGQAPALRFARPSPFHRRARACPSPCNDRNEKRRWLAFGFRLGLTLAGDRPPRYGPGRDSPRHAPFGLRRARTTVSCL